MENKDKVFNFFRFEDLRVYHKSLDLINWVCDNNENTETIIPHDIHHNMVKAATAIAVNIAEGSGRNKSQFIYYLKLAKSSVRECIVLNTICLNRSIFSQEQHDECRNLLIEISKMVGALISSLQRSKRNDNDEEDDDEGMTNPRIENNY